MIEGYEKMDSKQRELLLEEYLEGRALDRQTRKGFWISGDRPENTNRLPPISWVRTVWNEFVGSDKLQNAADKSSAFAQACRQLGYKEKQLKKEFTATDLSKKGKPLLSLPENQRALAAMISIINRK